MMGQTCGKAPPGPEWDADMGIDGGGTLPGTRCSRALGGQAHELCWLKLPQPHLPSLQQQPLLTILPRCCDLRVCNVARGQAEGVSAVCSQTGRRRAKTRES